MKQYGLRYEFRLKTHMEKAQKSFTNPLLFAGIMKEVYERLVSAI